MADDSSRNNHGHQQQEAECHQSLQHGDRRKEALWGDLCPSSFARDCRSTGNANVANSQKGNGATPKGNGCFECGASGHFKRDCPLTENKEGRKREMLMEWVYAVGNAEKGEMHSGKT
ncbi:putative reverse transcriptase domain-containing protein [Tanacetum coccineum]|uniref:Reverse transcriptase domain-containing protein n=1 Tax=Tanacetum coccineum TaxID=301880 RepID=A0ABQ4X8C5_9ASTR